MRLLSLVPAITLVAYTAGDVMGVKANLGQFDAVLHDIHVSDDGNQGAAGSFLFFDGDPGVVAADNAPFAFPTGALAKLLAVVASPTFATIGTKKVGTTALTVPIGLKSSQLYVVFVTSGTPTQVSVTDLKWKLKFRGNIG